MPSEQKENKLNPALQEALSEEGPGIELQQEDVSSFDSLNSAFESGTLDAVTLEKNVKDYQEKSLSSDIDPEEYAKLKRKIVVGKAILKRGAIQAGRQKYGDEAFKDTPY